MTMKATGQNGFVMILVIMALAAIGVVMFVLTDDSNTMIFESDTAYLRATQRNLTASALAWARHNIKDDSTQAFEKPVELDVAGLGRSASALTVSVGSADNGKPQVQITTSCTRKRRTLKSNTKHIIGS